MFFSVSACTDWLEVQPPGKVVLNNFWKTESDVEAVVMTCYRAMLEQPYMERIMVYGEFRADNVILSNSTNENLYKIFNANILPTNSYADWSTFYDVINYCNTVLYYAPQVNDPNFSQSRLNAKLAEVLTIRALNYFYLVRAFGEVPFVTEASVSDDQDYNIAKSSEDDILDQLEIDLIKAENWALSTYGSTESDKGRVTKTTIRALLADIYLWRNKFDECINYSDKVLADKTLQMIESDDNPYRRIFGIKNSTESIFETQYSITNSTKNTPVYNFYGDLSSKNGLFLVSQYITSNEALFSKTPLLTDVRLKDNIRTETLSGTQSLSYVFKYAGLYRTENASGISFYTYRDQGSSPANWIFYRLTDVMLMKAEALVQKNNLAPALHIVNTTYMRSNPTLPAADSLKTSDYDTKSKMEELVLLERQRELMFEGKRWFDLMRVARRDGNTNRLVDKVLTRYTTGVSDVSSKMKDMNSLFFPISESELNTNNKLEQNPYYLSTSK